MANAADSRAAIREMFQSDYDQFIREGESLVDKLESQEPFISGSDGELVRMLVEIAKAWHANITASLE